MELLFLIPLLPLIGAAINGLTGWYWQKKTHAPVNGIIASAAMGGAFIVALLAFIQLVQLDPEHRFLIQDLYPWISSGPFAIHMELRMDPLSAVMAMVVTGVGFLIHIYSIGYMAHDGSRWRYFSFLNLFAFAMLMLVLANNLLVMFIGWEGVGLCSYLLIGFWYSDLDKARAGMKAFIVNRVGDFGFLIGLFALAWGLTGAFGSGPVLTTSINYDFLRENVHVLAGQTLFGMDLPTFICICFFVGACGKSAQIPLYIWLPDAMAGPTPVSALIHAATMVTAGVYMVARLNYLFAMSPVAMAVVSIVGACTALFAATMGFAQTDIKKVLAYSTISQLGFMFIAVGVGAFGAGVFHLMTHAFFKACLFLGAGSVIHAMSGEQDIRKMGALRHKLPYTFWTFLIATLAISGIPGLSGFFSKDEILWRAFTSQNPAAPGLNYVIAALGLMAALCTAFYMFRVVYLTFFGETTRASDDVVHHVHESPATMTIPLVVLATLSILGGYIGLPALTGLPNVLEHFLDPVFEPSAHAIVFAEPGHAVEAGMMALSVALACLGIFAAWKIYIKGGVNGAQSIVARIPRLYKIVRDKYYVDEAYDRAVVQPFHGTSRGLSRFDNVVVDGAVNGMGWLTTRFSNVDGWLDSHIVDGMVNGTASIIGWFGRRFSRIQTGRIQDYVTILLSGVVVLVIVLHVVSRLLP
jgi:NADH-quinone oxidoreductase subunit L